MAPRRRAVSTYLETFLLVAVAAGGSAAVSSAMGSYVSSAGGAAFVLSGAVVRQGAYVAVERVSVANTGAVGLGSFTLTSAIPSSPRYCATLADGSGGEAVGFSPPPPACGSGTAPDPASVTIKPSQAVPPGGSVVLSVVIYSADEFQVGAEYGIVVSSSGAAEVVSVVAVPG